MVLLLTRNKLFVGFAIVPLLILRKHDKLVLSPSSQTSRRTQRSTVITLIIRTKLNNFNSGVRILWNTILNGFPGKGGGGGGGGVRIIGGFV